MRSATVITAVSHVNGGSSPTRAWRCGNTCILRDASSEQSSFAHGRLRKRPWPLGHWTGQRPFPEPHCSIARLVEREYGLQSRRPAAIVGSIRCVTAFCAEILAPFRQDILSTEPKACVLADPSCYSAIRSSALSVRRSDLTLIRGPTALSARWHCPHSSNPSGLFGLAVQKRLPNSHRLKVTGALSQVVANGKHMNCEKWTNQHGQDSSRR
jgi:hypothetical protein